MQYWGMTLSSNISSLFTYLGLHDFFRNELGELHYLNIFMPSILVRFIAKSQLHLPEV